MVEYTLISGQHARYLREGSWICKPSPSGAHHWIEVKEVVHTKTSFGTMATFVCKHCWENRDFPITYRSDRFTE